MKIISLMNGHDASITAIENGEIKFHWELERVLNIKHFCGVDHTDEITGVLLNHCLPKLNWEVKDISYVVFAGCTEWKRTSFAGQVPQYDKFDKVKPYAEGSVELAGHKIPAISVVHHLCHMAYAYFTSPFIASLLYSWDGIGDGTSSMCGIGSGNKIKIRHIFSQSAPTGTTNNGVGLAYSYLGRLFPFLGSDLLATAGKAMGLSSYGSPREEWREAVRSVITQWMPQPEKLLTLLKLDSKDLADPMNRVAQDLMATIQDELELYLIRTVKAMQTEEFALYHLPHPGAKNLCLSGGCSLNVQANSRLLNEKVVSNLYIPPAVSDCGVSIGAALYLWHHILDNKFEGVTWHSPYLGDTLYNAPPHFRIGCSNDVYGQNKHNEFEEFMEKYPTIVYKMKSEEEIIHGTAKLLAEGKIIAWAQGRAEIGPRALGNRSILCHPGYIKTERTPNFHSEYWHNGGCLTKGTMKDIINEKVKHREFWRPFAPIALWPDCVNYFELDHPSPYMLESPMGRCWGTERVVRWVPKWKDVCSTVHVDGTCRVQTVTDETNPLMFKLLTKFKEFSGLPVLLNTSLNDRGKPIANTLEDILNLLRDTELDYAIVDNWIFSKK